MQQEFRHLPPGEQEALRREALERVSRGERKSRVAHSLGVSRQAVQQWVRRFARQGVAGLAARPRGRRRSCPLLPWQEAQVAGTIQCLPPWKVNQEYECWTKKAVAAFVEESFGVRLSEWIVGSYLRRWGFASQREVRWAFEGGGAPLHSAAATGPGGGRPEARAAER